MFVSIYRFSTSPTNNRQRLRDLTPAIRFVEIWICLNFLLEICYLGKSQTAFYGNFAWDSLYVESLPLSACYIVVIDVLPNMTVFYVLVQTGLLKKHVGCGCRSVGRSVNESGLVGLWQMQQLNRRTGSRKLTGGRCHPNSMLQPWATAP
jgi:hypothetical protein